MSTRRTALYALSALLTIGITTPDSDAGTFTVGKSGITSIQGAIDAALANTEANDTILIPPGEYTESVVISFDGLPPLNQQHSLLITRSKAGLVKIIGVNNPAMHIKDAAGVKVKNITLDSGNPNDEKPALLIDGKVSNIQLDRLKGVVGDELGVRISGNFAIGVRAFKCNFSGMDGIGFLADGFGHEFVECRADNCKFNGFLLTPQALDCTITDCTALNSATQASGNPGAISMYGNGHRIRSTTTSGAALDGFYMVGNGHLLEKCKANNNGRAGFFMDTSSGKLKQCSAKGNLHGFLGGGLGATVEKGSYSDNTTHGLNVTKGGVNVLAVKANENGGDGVFVDNSANATKVYGCSMQKNGGEAVNVMGQLTWVEGNQAKGGDGFVDQGNNNSGRNNRVKGAATNDF